MEAIDDGGATARRDLAWIVVATVGFAAICVRVEFSEIVLAWTRPYERFQLDEVPGVLLFLAAAMAWYAWRRMREARVELKLRQHAEDRLSAALTQNRDLVHASLRMQEDEQRNLARELHDELGQYINAVKIDAASLRDGAGRHDAEVRAGSVAIMGMTDHLEVVVRDMVRRLRPPGLDELGLPAALESCVDGWRRRLPGVKFIMDVGEEIENLDEATNMTLYRLVQEGLTNVAKHARASRVEIAMLQTAMTDAGAAQVVLSVRDNGVGTPMEASGTGLGIAGMRERVEALAGRFDVTPVRGGGFGFIARLPIHSCTT